MSGGAQILPSAWQPGDLAECIDVQDFLALGDDGLPLVSIGGCDLRLGMIYLVAAVSRDPQEGYLLLDVGVPSGVKAAHRFRKVPPLSDEEPGALAVPINHLVPA